MLLSLRTCYRCEWQCSTGPWSHSNLDTWARVDTGTGALLSQLRCVRSLLIMVAWWQQRCFRSPVRQGDSGACHGKPILLPDNILGHPVRLADYYIPITWTMNNNIITLDTIEWGPHRFPVKIHFIFIASFFSKDIQWSLMIISLYEDVKKCHCCWILNPGVAPN